MKKALLSLAALATLATAAPAMAQPYGGYGGGYNGGYDNSYRGGRMDNDYGNFQRRIDQAEVRLERGIRNGNIDRREARALRQELRQIRVLESRYDDRGYTPWEARQLEIRLDRFEQRLRYQMRDDDRRGDGRWDGPGRYGDRR